MKWICLIVGVLCIAAPTQAAANEDCRVPPGAVKAELPTGLPPALLEKMGNIALPGEPFDTTDVIVKGHKNRRYIFVWNIGNRWIVATEQGGIALRAIIFVYDLRKDGKTVTLTEERPIIPDSVCATATSMAGR